MIWPFAKRPAEADEDTLDLIDGYVISAGYVKCAYSDVILKGSPWSEYEKEFNGHQDLKAALVSRLKRTGPATRNGTVWSVDKVEANAAKMLEM